MMRSNPTATPAASSTVAATPQTQDGTRKLVAQLRASERDAAKARAELRALKTTQQALVAQAEAKAALMEQQMKKNNAKAQQTAKQWKDRCDRAEDAANERVELTLKQKDEELLDIRAKCDDATARSAKANTVLEERGINPITLKPFEAREATELAQRTAERAAFMERLGELNEILMAREEALVRKLDQMAHMNAKLEAMPVEVPLVTV